MSVEQMTTRALPEDTAIAEFAARLRGPLIRRGEESYDTVRRVYNAMIDKYPDLIARCVDVADVISAVDFAREHRLTVAIRGGGHNGGGSAPAMAAS